jgi:hypothetical protein
MAKTVVASTVRAMTKAARAAASGATMTTVATATMVATATAVAMATKVARMTPIAPNHKIRFTCILYR